MVEWIILSNKFKPYTNHTVPVMPGQPSPWVRIVEELEASDEYVARLLFKLSKKPDNLYFLSEAKHLGPWYKLPFADCYSIHNRSSFYVDSGEGVNDTVFTAMFATGQKVAYTVRNDILIGTEMGINLPMLVPSPCKYSTEMVEYSYDYDDNSANPCRSVGQSSKLS